MNLIETLDFLSPAINKKNRILPVLDHVRIQGNYAIAYDGELAICCPCELPLTASPQGWTLERAAKLLKEGFQVAQLPNGDLQFFSGAGGKYKVVVPCTTDEFPMPNFQYATPVQAPAMFRDVLHSLLPFVFTQEDDSRKYLSTVLLRGGKAIATCKHTMAWCDLGIPTDIDVSVPLKAIKAMVGYTEAPEWISCTDTRFVAIYSGGRFLSTPSVATPWPQSVSTIMADIEMPMDAVPLMESLREIERFVSKTDKLYFINGTVATEPDGRGASCAAEYPALVEGKHIEAQSIVLARKHATKVGFRRDVMAWKGDGIEGRCQLGPYTK